MTEDSRSEALYGDRSTTSADHQTYIFPDHTPLLVDLQPGRKFTPLYSDKSPLAAQARTAIETGDYSSLALADVTLQNVGIGRKFTLTSAVDPGRLITLFPGVVKFGAGGIHVFPPPGTPYAAGDPSSRLSPEGFFMRSTFTPLLGTYQQGELMEKMNQTQQAGIALGTTAVVPEFHYISSDQNGHEFGAYSTPDGVAPLKVLADTTADIVRNGINSVGALPLEIGVHKLGRVLRQLGIAGKIHGQPHMGNYLFPKGDIRQMIDGKLVLSDFETLQNIPRELPKPYVHAARLREADIACDRYTRHIQRLIKGIEEGTKGIPENRTKTAVVSDLNELDARIRYALYHGFSGLETSAFFEEQQLHPQNRNYADVPVWKELDFVPGKLQAFRMRMESKLRENH